LTYYIEEINGFRILKSDLFNEINHCFTIKTIPYLNSYDWSKIVFPFAEKTISPQQTHSDEIDYIDKRFDYPNTDGLILTQKNIVISLRFADCTPLIFYDTKQKIGAISHAGWRGTAQKIGPKTILKMNSNPRDVKVLIGPTIGVCCYEVSTDVKNKLLATIIDTTNLAANNNVDLKQINKRQLEEMGVNKIDVCSYCTSCNNDLFYSYRKENGTNNRHFAMLML